MAETPTGDLRDRQELRRKLLAERAAWVGTEAHTAAEGALAVHLREVLAALEPTLLGLYWPIRSEFNARLALQGDTAVPPLALPFTRKTPRDMEYRRWDGHEEPGLLDECRIPSVEGAVVVPDVVLVPCVGYSAEGYRLGYGGGYFDRWLAAHPQATAVGIAWASSEVSFEPEQHDRELMIIVTERGVVTPAHG
jgi:5-formyltetrahydrofolate cyclo-ligase